jgi:hypothetical protein
MTLPDVLLVLAIAAGSAAVVLVALRFAPR